MAANSPPLDWHLANCNYVNQTALDVPPVTIDGMTLAPLGEGPGMLGLPGDFTPPSRFVRAATFSATARKPATAAEGLCTVMHLLSSFDITKGVIRGPPRARAAGRGVVLNSASGRTPPGAGLRRPAGAMLRPAADG